jgi:hypothetical protein
VIWRESYSTRVIECPVLPSLAGRNLSAHSWSLLPGGSLVGGFSPEALVQMEIWCRLIGDRAVSVLLRSAWRHADFAEIQSLVPKSRWNRTVLGEPDIAWRELIAPDSEGRAFAAINTSPALLMVGPPTEEAWERFSVELSRQSQA